MSRRIVAEFGGRYNLGGLSTDVAGKALLIRPNPALSLSAFCFLLSFVLIPRLWRVIEVGHRRRRRRRNYSVGNADFFIASGCERRMWASAWDGTLFADARTELLQR
jgi:hypothetical protein